MNIFQIHCNICLPQSFNAAIQNLPPLLLHLEWNHCKSGFRQFQSRLARGASQDSNCQCLCLQGAAPFSGRLPSMGFAGKPALDQPKKPEEQRYHSSRQYCSNVAWRSSGCLGWCAELNSRRKIPAHFSICWWGNWPCFFSFSQKAEWAKTN